MFSELKKLKKGTFELTLNDNLRDKCNAPSDMCGIYIVYTSKELIYIGRSGRKLQNGSMRIRKAGLGGIKDRIVNGHHPLFGKIPRRKSWQIQMKKEKIEKLRIDWFVCDEYTDCPKNIEKSLLMSYREKGKLPKWHKQS
jgi:hypothetical protein